MDLEKMIGEMEAKIRRDKQKRTNTQELSQQSTYRCPDCHDREFILNHQNNTAIPCKCREVNVIRRLIKSSGLTASQRDIYFHNLDPNRSNRQMYWMARKYLNDFNKTAYSDAENKGIGFLGSVGSGKTTLLLAVANALIDQQLPVIFVNTPNLFAELLDAQWNGGGDESVNAKIHRLSTTKLVIFDDVGKETTTDRVRGQYYRIINQRYADRLPTCFTSNFDFSEIGHEEKLGDAIASRLYALTKGRQLNIQAEDYRLA